MQANYCRRIGRVTLLSAVGVIAAAPLLAAVQSAPNHAAHQPPSTAPADTSLSQEVASLRAHVVALQASLQRDHRQSTPSGTAMPMGDASSRTSIGGAMAGSPNEGVMSRGNTSPAGQMGMGGMSGGQSSSMGMMDMPGMMQDMRGGMGPKSGGGMSMPMPGAGMEREMMGMMGMAPGNGMAVTSSLPGFPGSSHLYHVGATGFFLDHGEHVTLTAEQQAALGRAREKALMEKDAAERRVEAAEQELWTLTASDQPDAEKIEAKVREVEKLRGDQRLNFIRAVGEAAKVLTDEQRKSLLGQLPPQIQPSPAPAGGMGGGGMKGM